MARSRPSALVRQSDGTNRGGRHPRRQRSRPDHGETGSFDTGAEAPLRGRRQPPGPVHAPAHSDDPAPASRCSSVDLGHQRHGHILVRGCDSGSLATRRGRERCAALLVVPRSAHRVVAQRRRAVTEPPRSVASCRTHAGNRVPSESVDRLERPRSVVAIRRARGAIEFAALAEGEGCTPRRREPARPRARRLPRVNCCRSPPRWCSP